MLLKNTVKWNKDKIKIEENNHPFLQKCKILTLYPYYCMASKNQFVLSKLAPLIFRVDVMNNLWFLVGRRPSVESLTTGHVSIFLRCHIRFSEKQNVLGKHFLLTSKWIFIHKGIEDFFLSRFLVTFGICIKMGGEIRLAFLLLIHWFWPVLAISKSIFSLSSVRTLHIPIS